MDALRARLRSHIMRFIWAYVGLECILCYECSGALESVTRVDYISFLKLSIKLGAE